MKYTNPRLRDMLAAEYVLGTLPRRVRARFERLLRYDVALRRSVEEWEARLSPLATQIPEIQPARRVWRAIHARVSGHSAPGRWWHRLAWWRGFSAVAATAAIVLSTLILLREPAPEPVGRVGVLNDAQAQPAMLVTWPPQNKPSHRHVRVKMLTQIVIPADKTLQLWLLSGAKAAPIFLGAISNERIQTLEISAAVSKALPGSWGVGVSVEPAGHSTGDGGPTEPLIMSGPCVRMN